MHLDPSFAAYLHTGKDALTKHVANRVKITAEIEERMATRSSIEKEKARLEDGDFEADSTSIESLTGLLATLIARSAMEAATIAKLSNKQQSEELSIQHEIEAMGTAFRAEARELYKGGEARFEQVLSLIYDQEYLKKEYYFQQRRREMLLQTRIVKLARQIEDSAEFLDGSRVAAWSADMRITNALSVIERFLSMANAEQHSDQKAGSRV